MTEISEIQLIKQYLAGDRESLELLIKRYLGSIYRFVYYYVGNASDAEDITQEVFIKFWRKIKRYDPEKSFKAWIFSIAKNTALDFLKKKKDIPFAAFADKDGDNIIIDTLADPEQFLDELVAKEDSAKLIKEALDKLSPSSRLVLNLYYTDGYNLREISEILDEPLDTTKSRYRRALIMLKKIISNANIS